ncbi:kinase-like domain-containing protein [Fusarium globosum]|uniref:Kinase-like domain-containing protein n=1 Tax=Fusarium globosum TaxID=78864 RepID=A0A8H5YM42_9HYPO|nr:kinase-like domain-containing protein [Fusarium globosum]
MDEELESEDPAIEHLQKHVDDLAPDVFEIQVSPQDPDKKLVFKYYFLDQRLSYVWHEMNLWMRLPKHSHIAAFDKIVVDEIEGRCVGFTTEYIPGGTLEENKSRTFKLKWLTQLIAVVDELNLNLGVAHQDIAPRNLLVDETADSIIIFDFNFSVRVGEPGYSEARNDIKGVLFTIYEIITRDETLRAVRHEDQNVQEIEKKEWVQHPDVQLDHPVSEFREVLREWSDKRCRGKQLTTYKDAPNFIDWPDTPQPPLSEMVVYYDGKPTTELVLLWSTERKRMLEQGKTVLNWQRPPQCKLKPGDRILETGEFIERA